MSTADSTVDGQGAAQQPLPGRLDRFSRNWWLALAGLACAYAAAGWLGLQLAAPPGYATILWPPSGLALAALLLLSRSLWPGIFVGSLAINIVVGHALGGDGVRWTPLLAAAIIATGSTVQAVFASTLLRREFGAPFEFRRGSDVLRFGLLAGPLSCTIACTFGVAALWIGRVLQTDSILQNWLTWWAGDVAGIFVLLPIALLGPWRQTKLLWRGERLPSFSATMVIGLFVLLGATLAAWKLTSVTTYERNRATFEALTNDSERALRDRLRSYRLSLDGAAALFEASQHISQREWRSYVDTLDLTRTLPGISGMGFIQPMTAGAFPGIHPDTPWSRKFVVTHIEPMPDDSPVRGLDIAFETNRREAALHARDTGRATITRRISLVRDHSGSTGFLLLRPIYFTDRPTRNFAERRAALRGWIYAPFMAPQFMANLTASQGRSFQFKVYDGPRVDPRALIYSTAPATDAAPQANYIVTRSFPVMEQNWTVSWSSTPEFESSVGTSEPWLILGGGLGLTIAFAFLLLSYSRRESYVRREVDVRTRELREAVEALAESEQRFSDLAGLSPAGIMRTDAFGFCTYVNDAWLDSSGLTASKALGAGWITAIHPLDRERFRREWMASIGKADRFRTELRFARPDGEPRWIDFLCEPHRDSTGAVSGFIGVAVDITEHRQAVDALRDSERRFQTLADFAPAGIFRTDAAGQCSYVNPAWSRMAGLTREEAMGDGWVHALHPDDRERVARDWAEAVARRQDYRAELRWLHAGGTIVWADVLGRAEVDEAGVLLGFIGITLDVSERKLAEQELAERDAQLSLLAANATDAVFRIGLDGQCLYASPSARDVIGVEPSRLVGQQMLTWFHPQDRSNMLKLFNDLAHGRRNRFVVAYRARKGGRDGEYVWLEANAGLVRNGESDAPEEVIASIRDISDRKQLEFELVEARRNAEAAASAKAAFLANMSHEIRTPMNGVIGFTELLLDGELNQTQRGHAQMIADSGRAMMRLLNDILDISKIDAGQMRVTEEAVDLRHKLRSCVRLMQPTASAKRLRLDFDVDARVPAYVRGDPLRIRQIVLNLIGNAVKFTDDGSVTVHADVATVEGRPKLRIAVRDTGIGIPPDRIEAIFQHFTQADSTTARRYGGTGLGLTISSQLAGLMHGDLSVESRVGEGSVFTLTLPLIEAEKPDADADAAQDSPLPAAAAAPRVLVAEDHDVNQMLMLAMAERAGFDAQIAPDGAEAVRMVTQAAREGRPYRLVLMDMQMPRVDGLEATRRLRAAGFGAETLPIVALTANAYAEDVNACLAAGMQAHLAKPVQLRDLEAVAARWLADAPVAKAPPAPPASVETRYRARRAEALNALFALEGRSAPTAQEAGDVAALLHKLAGSAAFFGEETLGSTAADYENLLRNAGDAERAAVAAQAAAAIGQAARAHDAGSEAV